MKHSILLWLVTAAFAFAIVGCKNRREQRPASPAASAEAAEDEDETTGPELSPTVLTTTGVLASIQIRTPSGVLPPGPVAVDSRPMKYLFPRRIGLLKLKSCVDETSPRDPQPEAMASAHYEGPLAGRLKITVTDFGRQPPQLETRFGLTWLGVHIDRETDRGYERDGRLGLFRYYESLDRVGGYGQISVLWNNRLLIEIESFRLAEWHLLQALRALNWDLVFPPTATKPAPLRPPDASPASL